ncbi:putative ABC transporter permease subunit [Massilia niastensis]|uniref:putative ABC transporter permease subunit n=1 Tax=Massilia niastensis TaxID=544911 RepID=UPI00037BEB05|nr:hypothetical protein [Massilia niastensis]
MSMAPGSVGWLLRHELRLFWYGAAQSKATGTARRPGNTTLAVFGIAWCVLHGAAWVAVDKLSGIGSLEPRILVALTLTLAACATFMLSTAIKASVVALFERGDLDLLLSSPLPSHSIFAVRLAGVVAGTAAIYLFLLAPFAHVGLAQGAFRWLAVYPVIIGLACLCACAGMLLTLALVRLLGARRTRVVAQVLGAMAGALLFILSQLYSLFSRSAEDRAGAVIAGLLARDGALAADSPLWLLGRAGAGEPAPVLALAAAAALAFVLTARHTHRFFVRGLQQAASSKKASRPQAGPLRFRFRRSLFDTIVIKEWRLIVRDPHLISQVLLQLIYLLPLCFLIFSKSDIQTPAIGAGLTLLCSSLTGALAWIVISAEDAPDLLRVSPAAQRTVRLAKLAAATMPPFMLVAMPLLWLLWRLPLAGLLVCFTVSAAVTGAGLIVMWCGRPGLRSDFKGRGKGSFVVNMLELFNSLSWGALAGLLVSASIGEASGMMLAGAAAAALVGCLTLCAAWLLRRPQP